MTNMRTMRWLFGKTMIYLRLLKVTSTRIKEKKIVCDGLDI